MSGSFSPVNDRAGTHVAVTSDVPHGRHDPGRIGMRGRGKYGPGGA
jgi:hypothetical protein